MAKTYKILVNDGKGTDIKPVSVEQGVGAKGEPVHLVAKRGWRFQLQDELKGKGLAPDQVRLKRVGKDLVILFDGSQRADVVIEDYYAENTDKDKDNGMPTLVGNAENGGMYEYVPQDPAISSMPAELKDGNTPVIVSLGGGPLGDDFVLSALPLVAAAGGVSGWLVAGGVAAAAAAGGGGGGGSGAAVVVVPAKATGSLTHDATNDTGTLINDSYTKNNKPQLTINAEHGATVVVTVNGKDYNAIETSTPGVYTVEVGGNEALGKLNDGKYTPVIKVTNSAGSSTADGTPFMVDQSATKNQPDNKDDPNNVATIEISAVSDDTGGDAHDFVTSDTTVLISGKVTGFSNSGVAAGERVHIQILDATNKVLVDEYVVPASDGTWVTAASSAALPIAKYTISATIEDAAGNVVKAVTQPLEITDVPSGQTGGLKHDALDDTGISQTDSITNNQNPIYTGLADKGADIEVVIAGVTYQTKASSTDGTYSFVVDNKGISNAVGGTLADGVYASTVKSTLNGKTSQVAGTTFTIDHSTATNQPNNQVDPNKDAKIEISAVSEDTGTDIHDFITTDAAVFISGKVTGFTNSGVAKGERVRIQILDTSQKIVAEEFVDPASDGTWTTITPTTALINGMYTIKAVIEDIAGNQVQTTTHSLQITDASVTANPDTNSVTEDTLLTVNGGLIAGDSKGGVADSATAVAMSGLKVSQIKVDAGAYQQVSATGETVIIGVFGKLSVQADGTYQYALSNTDVNVQALSKTPGKDKFFYTLTDGLNHTSETTLTVVVNGQNDVPFITGASVKQISQTGPASVGDKLVIADADAGESKLEVGVLGTKFKGQFGEFEINDATNPVTAGSYDWTYTKNNGDLGSSDSIRHDLFVVKSLDGTASQTFDMEVTSPIGLIKQEFHALTSDGLVVNGKTTTTDTLDMHGSGVFDFTQVLTKLNSVEIINADFLHTGSNTVKLNLASLMQADNHVLTVLGDSNDFVVMVGATFSSKVVNSVPGFTDYTYVATNNDELHLIVQSVMSQTGIG